MRSTDHITDYMNMCKVQLTVKIHCENSLSVHPVVGQVQWVNPRENPSYTQCGQI